MKRIIFILLLLPLFTQAQTGVKWDRYFFTGSMKIGAGLQGYANATLASQDSISYADTCALLEVGAKGIKRAMIVPRLKSKDSVVAPKMGMFGFDTTSKRFVGYNGSAWKPMDSLGTSYTETDPIFSAHAAFGVTAPLITNWTAAYNDKINSASFSGTTTKTLTLTQQDGGTVTGNFTDDNTTYSAGTGLSLVGTTFNSTQVGVTDGDKGDITVSSTGTAWNLDAGSVSNSELANSTISGISLGSNLGTLTINSPLTGTSYNGSAGVTLDITGIGVADGGTGLSSATAYSVLCGGTTSTGAFQSVSGLGSSGHVLTSNGAGALPTWQAPSGGGGEDLDATVALGNTVTDQSIFMNKAGSDSVSIVLQNSGVNTALVSNGAGSGHFQAIRAATGDYIDYTHESIDFNGVVADPPAHAGNIFTTGYYAGGTATFSGDGVVTVFNIAHGLGTTPSIFLTFPGSAAAAVPGRPYITADATNIIITYATTPPVSGTNNVVWQWIAIK